MVTPQLQQWVDEGLISLEQAKAIERFEAARRAPARPARRRTVVAEVLGSLGSIAAAVAAVVGTAVLWDDLTTVARVGIPTVGALGLLAAGAVVPRARDAPTDRLGALLWLLSIAAVGAAVSIALVELTDLADQNVVLATGLVVLALATASTGCGSKPIWWRASPAGWC